MSVETLAFMEAGTEEIKATTKTKVKEDLSAWKDLTEDDDEITKLVQSVLPHGKCKPRYGTYGLLKVLGFCGVDENLRRTMYAAQCECGSVKEYAGGALDRALHHGTKSCGCRRHGLGQRKTGDYPSDHKDYSSKEKQDPIEVDTLEFNDGFGDAETPESVAIPLQDEKPQPAVQQEIQEPTKPSRYLDQIVALVNASREVGIPAEKFAELADRMGWNGQVTY